MALRECPEPEPGEGPALVRIEAIGVDFFDVCRRMGLHRIPLTFIPGNEAAGTAVNTGSGVSEVAAGDRVAYAGVPGSYAGQAAVAARRLVRLPEGVDAKAAEAHRRLAVRLTTGKVALLP